MCKRGLFTLCIILTLNFFLPRMMRADPLLFLSEDDSGLSLDYSPEERAKYAAYYGLDKPLGTQYLSYLKDAAQGEFGYSIIYNRPVSDILKERIGWTLFVVTASLFFSLVLGILLGVFAARFQHTLLDRLLVSLSVVLSQIPGFITATTVFLLFSTTLRGVLPTSGALAPFAGTSLSAACIKDIMLHALLPVGTLSLIRTPSFTLLMRSTMITEIQKKYVTAAHAKGVPEQRILFHHCALNALNPVITKACMSMGRVFGGAVIIETVFQYPGVGLLIRDSVFTRDYPVIQAVFFLMAFTTIIFTTLAEIFYQRRG